MLSTFPPSPKFLSSTARQRVVRRCVAQSTPASCDTTTLAPHSLRLRSEAPRPTRASSRRSGQAPALASPRQQSESALWPTRASWLRQCAARALSGVDGTRSVQPSLRLRLNGRQTIVQRRQHAKQRVAAADFAGRKRGAARGLAATAVCALDPR